jgi:hypothetical protein
MRLEMVLPQAAAEFAKLPTAVRRVLQLCDGTRTLDAVCAAGGLPVPQARQVVERLEQLGLVAARAEERKRKKQLTERTLQWIRAESPPAPSAFSNDEEAFFASSIDHLVEEQLLQ